MPNNEMTIEFVVDLHLKKPYPRRENEVCQDTSYIYIRERKMNKKETEQERMNRPRMKK